MSRYYTRLRLFLKPPALISVQPRDYLFISDIPEESNRLVILIKNNKNKEIKPNITVEFPEGVYYYLSGNPIESRKFTIEEYRKRFDKDFVVKPKGKRKIVLVPVYRKELINQKEGTSADMNTVINVNVDKISYSKELQLKTKFA